MKIAVTFWIAIVQSLTAPAFAAEFDADRFAQRYFDAWVMSQSPEATGQDLEVYLALLADDVGHQHLPYDPDDSRNPTGKQDMRDGMGRYLGAHTHHEANLISYMAGHDVIVLQYSTLSKGIHPQTHEEIAQDYLTVEVLEIEDGKVAMIRKYSP